MTLLKHFQRPLFETIASEAEKLNLEVYVIGGYVRDLLLNRPCKDIDFVTNGDGIILAKAVAKALKVKKVSVFKTFGTAHMLYKGLDLEFVGARKESYASDSRNPKVEKGSLSDDQNRRDFTINALAVSLQKDNYAGLIDPFGGLEDLKNKLLKTPLSPGITYSDDPLRMMRAIRFATQLNFRIDEASFDAITENKTRIHIVSAERVSTELNKIILAKTPSIGFHLLRDTGLLGIVFPEMLALEGAETKQGIGHKDNFLHTLEVLDNVAQSSDDLWLRWAAIMHDIAKPATKRFHPELGWTFHGHEDKGSRWVPIIFKRMKLPLDHKMRFVQKLVLLHLRPIALTKEEISDSAIRRLLFEAGDDIDALMILCRADITSKNEKKVKRYLKNYELVVKKLQEVEEKDRIRNFQPPISGELIMKSFSIGPCKEVGIIKNAIKDAILDGEISNNYSEGYSFMLRKGKALGLKV